MPVEIDEVDRRRQLEIERAALQKETDPASKERLERLEKELADLEERSHGMRAHWEQEKDCRRIRALKSELEESARRRSERSATAIWRRQPSSGSAASWSWSASSRRRTRASRRSSRNRRC